MTSFIVNSSWLIPFYGLISSLLTLPWALGLWRNAGPRLAAYINLVMTLGSVIHLIFGLETRTLRVGVSLP